MRMVFTPSEICQIVRTHLAKEWGLPPTCIVNVQMFGSGETRIEADIKTAPGGGPYRGKPDIRPDET